MTKRLITDRDILTGEVTSPICLDGDTLITPAARDRAASKGMVIVESHEEVPEASEEEELASSGQESEEEDLHGYRPSTGGGASETLIVTSVGVNRPGVLAELTSAVGALGGDIQDVSQRITGGYFNAILVVDIRNSGKDIAAFREGFASLPSSSDDVINVIDARVFRAMHRL